MVKLAIDQESTGKQINLGDVDHPLKEVEGVLVA
jgi:hypothetical protein